MFRILLKRYISSRDGGNSSTKKHLRRGMDFKFPTHPSNPKRLCNSSTNRPQKASQGWGPWPSRNAKMFLQVASVWYQTCKTCENREPSVDRLVLSGNLTWLDSYQRPPLYRNNHGHGETRHSSFSQHASSASKIANLGTFQAQMWPKHKKKMRQTKIQA